AVAIAISIAVAGWLFGLWGSFATGSPQIQVSAAKLQLVNADSGGTGTKDDLKVMLYIVNEGSASDRILGIDVQVDSIKASYDNNETITVTISADGTSTTDTDGPPVVVPANFSGWIELVIDKDLTSVPPVGSSALIKVYFEKSGVTSIPAVVTEG
ncbi:hypothetical protein, partial [Aeropyrum pernix]|uniref:hypothetical protein n=1 Tax=Aeropyrum pernix TaxID=56636 RepID=UPI0013F1751C